MFELDISNFLLTSTRDPKNLSKSKSLFNGNLTKTYMAFEGIYKVSTISALKYFIRFARKKRLIDPSVFIKTLFYLPKFILEYRKFKKNSSEKILGVYPVAYKGSGVSVN